MYRDEQLSGLRRALETAYYRNKRENANMPVFITRIEASRNSAIKENHHDRAEIFNKFIKDKKEELSLNKVELTIKSMLR